MKKPSPKTLKKKCDDLFGKIVRHRGRCEMCDSRRNLQCCHIISRKYSHTRHDLYNALCLCAKCHRWSHDFPSEFGIWVVKKLGEGAHNALIRRSQRLGKVDYEQTHESLKLIRKLQEVGE